MRVRCVLSLDMRECIWVLAWKNERKQTKTIGGAQKTIDSNSYTV